MIQLIGFMIGMYILTRMAENLFNKEAHGFIFACSLITIIVVFVCMFNLLVKGINMPSLPTY